LGDYHASAGQFAKAADATSGFASPLLVCVYSTRAGIAADGAAAENAKRLVAIVDRPKESPWRIALAKLYLGEGTEKDALAAIPEDPPFLRKEAECEVCFYLGAWRHMRGDIRDARGFYEKCLGTGIAHFIEYGLAKAELQRLQKQ
jgi:lipoprotein NlpI